MGTNCSPRAPRVSRALSPEAELVSLCWLHAELVLTSLDVRAYKSRGLWCTMVHGLAASACLPRGEQSL